MTSTRAKARWASSPRIRHFADKLQDTINRLSRYQRPVGRWARHGRKVLARRLRILQQFEQLLLESRELIKAIRQNPKKYLSIKLHIF